jgi:hypothetical protein
MSCSGREDLSDSEACSYREAEERRINLTRPFPFGFRSRSGPTFKILPFSGSYVSRAGRVTAVSP